MVETNLTYRKADARDFQQLKALGLQSYTEYQQVLSDDNWQKLNTILHSDQNLDDLMQQSTVFVCEHEAAIVGMIYLVASGNPTKLFKSEWSYIRFLGVRPEYRGKGIGKVLTEQCIDHAIANGEKQLALHTGEFMHAARAIYEKRGFQIVEEIEYFGKRYWIYLLELNRDE